MVLRVLHCIATYNTHATNCVVALTPSDYVWHACKPAACTSPASWSPWGLGSEAWPVSTVYAEEISQGLTANDLSIRRAIAGPCLPARGLRLKHVYYSFEGETPA